MDKFNNMSDSFSQSEKSKSRRGFINKTFAKLSEIPILGNAFKLASSNSRDISGKDAYTGEIAFFPYEFVPLNWMICDGTALQISDYEALHSLIITTYGGDGFKTFKLPDFRGMVPINIGIASSGTRYTIGQTGGSTSVAMSINQMPAHSHILSGNSNPGISITPDGNYLAGVTGNARFNSRTDNTSLNENSLGLTGSGEPFSIVQPFLALRICICVNGIYPNFS